LGKAASLRGGFSEHTSLGLLPASEAGLDTGVGDAGSAKGLLSLSVSDTSKEERVGAFIILIRIGQRKIENLPVGDWRTSWSRVMHLPPAFVILARADSVKRRAATVSLGTS